ncbi:MAG: transaldolase [Gemmatimonadales bacterium]
MTVNPLIALGQLGQSPWYDFITRDLLASGGLRRLIEDDGLRGMTSNPTIFEKAIAGSELYDHEILGLMSAGCSPAQIFEGLAVADVRAACDAFAALYASSKGSDGLVSLEVSPTLAHDAARTVAEAERLWQAVGRPNLMIKIPGTRAGLPAITRCLAAGINVNVTLLFSVARYQEVIDAFQTGLEQRAERNLSIRGIASVASFFVSRVDTKVDAQLDRMIAGGTSHLARLRGQAAIANACLAYQAFERSLAGPRWQRLAGLGAQPQRPLWASTSTKDPALSDVYYVERLVAPWTVNTLPPDTFAAYRDHGRPEVRIHAGITEAPATLQTLTDAGISLEVITRELEDEGVAKFAASYTSLLAGIETKSGILAGRA